ncbi:hypothetical protein JCM3765_005752, partial [Sporobolomyces pararoseus]
PSLRLLAYYHKDGLLPGIEQALSGLLPQLHIVSLEYNSIPMLNPDLLKKLDSITLFDAEIVDLNDTIPISYLRFELYKTKHEFDSLTRSLQRASLSLPLTIYLPLFASPDQPDPLKMTEDRLTLAQACAARGIEVVYENPPEKWYLDSGFSEHFSEKMRKERRKRGGDV